MTTDEASTETIGDRIKRRRDELHLTQDDIAGKIGVSRAAVAQWELNQTAPIRRRMTELGEALECSANWLSYGEGGQAARMSASVTMSRVEFEAALRDAMQAGFDAAMAGLSRIKQ
jgi:transcriptional regulator with XRE-family HTH domain